jgi:hypothetical protein
LAACLLSLARVGLAFSGDDLLYGSPWYHEEITEAAAKAVGFSLEAADAIGWHADYVDSYAYNPFWWVLGGLDRFKVNLSTKSELAKVHFDDLFSAVAVRNTYRRYFTGTIAGLIWASERNDVSAARNIVGISLHAVQDFYSHSNWVDAPERRNVTWFDVGRVERARLAIWTGSYELPHHLGIKPHGTFVPSCVFLDLPAVRDLLDIGCEAWSPLTKFPVCEIYRLCKEGVSVQPEVLGVTLPKETLFLAPPGIALDSPWQSKIAVQVRGLTDISGEQAFRTAYDLATRASIQWLTKLEGTMARIGKGAFWDQVKTAPPAENWQAEREREYEQFDRFPYTFLSVGPYPPDPGGTTLYSDGAYLRVRLRTSGESGAGTDANIALVGYVGNQPGKEFLLDYMPKANPLIAHNDFEAGDNTVYVVGPFADLPDSITLENRAPDLPKVLGRLLSLFADAAEDYITSLRDFLASLIGAHADHIGTRKKVWTAAELKAIGAEPQPFAIDVDGGGEGHYKVHGTIRKTDETADTTPWGGYYKFQVRLEKLECVKESVIDRLSNSDEPFVLALLQPLPGDLKEYRGEPFDDVDDGETRELDGNFENISLPKSYGMLNLAISLFESDDETGADRADLMQGFTAQFQVKTKDLVTEVATTLGEAIGADWKLEEIEVYAFSRGELIRTGTVLNQRVDRFIDAGKKETFSLNRAALQGWPEIDLEGLEDAP